VSGIIGVSKREIDALSDAARALSRLGDLTDNRIHNETAEVLYDMLRRLSRMYGTSAEVRSGEMLVEQIRAVLPPDEEGVSA
jgi:hypothetical protein